MGISAEYSRIITMQSWGLVLVVVLIGVAVAATMTRSGMIWDMFNRSRRIPAWVVITLRVLWSLVGLNCVSLIINYMSVNAMLYIEDQNAPLIPTPFLDVGIVDSFDSAGAARSAQPASR